MDFFLVDPSDGTTTDEDAPHGFLPAEKWNVSHQQPM